MVDICPTVTAADARTYRVQLEQVVKFARRLHIDVADGQFTPNKLLELDYVWWPGGLIADIHVMYLKPQSQLEALIGLHPQLVIVHAEAEGNFMNFAETLHHHGIEAGVALLPETPVESILPAINVIDHVLIFSGQIGYFGGHANLDLLSKVKQLKEIKPSLEIGWDGGVDDKNALELTKAGVEVLNAGGFIHGATNPEEAYNRLRTVVNGGVDKVDDPAAEPRRA
ncbi:MAG TPA: hypothetical protein VMR95_00820 [Candidatus Binatia bacterium]|nr:hypothetical protein [Candidatus Binatia bacterium]